MRVAVVGAGLCGLVAARELSGAGHDVVVFDKGRSPGGRMATRRIAGARLDHGAQFFTVRSDEFAEQVRRWERDGVVRVWCHGFDGDGDGHPRYVGTDGMNAVAKSLATGLDVRCDTRVFAVRRGGDAGAAHVDVDAPRPEVDGWEVVIDDGSVHHVDAAVITCPTPQTFSLLFETGMDLPRELFGDDYDRTLGLLAVLDGPSGVPAPGGRQLVETDDQVFTFVADNQQKGISDVPALTMHAGPGWSETHWDDDPDVALAALVEHAEPWLGDAGVVEAHLKRWRFATPRSPFPDPCWLAPEGSLVIAGDAFAGPKVEGAYRSGLAAASALTSAS